MLSTCVRCKKRRIKCDTQLPACRSCTKAGVDCVSWERGEKVSREEIYHALQKVLALREKLDKKLNRPAPRQPFVEALPDAEVSLEPKNQTVEDLLPFRWETVKKGFWFGEDRGADALHLGPTSPISLLLWASWALNVRVDPPSYTKEVNEDFVLPRSIIKGTVVKRLLKNYEEKIYPEYPLLEPSFFVQDVKLKKLEPRKQFFTLLTLAASSAHLMRMDKDYRVVTTVLRQWVGEDAPKFLSQHSDDTFLTLLFLVLLEQIEPRHQNVYLLLGLACRFAVIRGYYRDTTEDEELRTSRRTLFLVLYKLEANLSDLISRPMMLPCESINFDRADEPIRKRLEIELFKRNAFRMIYNGPDDVCVFTPSLVDMYLSLPQAPYTAGYWFLAAIPFLMHRCPDCEVLHENKHPFMMGIMESMTIRIDYLYGQYKEDRVLSMYTHTLYCFNIGLSAIVFFERGYLEGYWTTAHYHATIHRIIEMMGYCRLGWSPASLYLKTFLQFYHKLQDRT